MTARLPSRGKFQTKIVLAAMAVAGLVIATADETNRVPPVALAFEPALFSSPSGAELPAWIRAAGYAEGDVGGEPSAWHGAAALPEGAGRVWIELNRAEMNEDLSLTLLYERNANADMAIQLCDAEGRVVALDLFRSVMAIADQAGTDTFIVPVRKFPSATRIVLRRISGDVKLYGAVLAPVVTEQPGEIDVMLDLLKRLGDRLSPESDLVRRIKAIAEAKNAAATAAASRPVAPAVLAPPGTPEALPPPEPIRFSGFDWTPMRTDFQVIDGTLQTLPHPRAGKFSYGHWGHGRGGAVVAEVGSSRWRDYTIDVDIKASGIDPSFNLHGLPSAFAGAGVMFRVVGYKESWNDPGTSAGYFYIRNSPQENHYLWSVGGVRNHYAKAPSGWFNVYGGTFEAASGEGLKLDRERGNHIRITVQGDRVRVWVDDALICDVTDARYHEAFDDLSLDHGGFGVSWMWETMGSFKNFTVRPIDEGDRVESEHKGLLLWNRLGSDLEVRSGMVGPGGKQTGGRFVEGRFGNGIELNMQEQFGVTFPPEIVPAREGCIEFWARLEGFPDALPWGDRPGLIAACNESGVNGFLLHFNGNDGAANGGLCARLGGLCSVGTGRFGEWTYARALAPKTVEGWHHYALVWAADGIPGVDNGTRKAAVFVDGEVNSRCWNGSTGKALNVPTTGRFGLLSHQGMPSGSVVFDNLKIWDYAQTDFRDRNEE